MFIVCDTVLILNRVMRQHHTAAPQRNSSLALVSHPYHCKMATSKSDVAEKLEIAPLRTLDDFIFESARFQMPNVKDLDKWGYRVYNNLIYYQSNYFLMAVGLFVIIGFLHPVKMILGLLAVSVALLLFAIASNAGPQVSRFKQDHPIASLAITSVGIYFVIYLLDGMLVFLLGILLPLSAIFIHASLRLRNIRNKFTNKMEQIGLKKLTPMGIIIDSLGFEVETN